jgi:hypothetical protein
MEVAEPGFACLGARDQPVDLIITHTEEVRLRSFQFGQPPPVKGLDMIGLDLHGDPGLSFDLSHVVFNVDPFTVIEPVSFHGFGMNFHDGFPGLLPQPGDHPVLGMKEKTETGPVDHDQGIFFIEFQGRDRALGRLFKVSYILHNRKSLFGDQSIGDFALCVTDKVDP